MNLELWRIASEGKEHSANDMSGEGASRSSGRWNREGFAVVYASTTIALACLETVVHANGDDLPLNRYLVRIDVPPYVWKARASLTPKSIPAWDAIPAGKASKDAGDSWVLARDTALMEVPSVIVPEETNVLINPAHPDARKLRATAVRKWLYDSRLRATS